MKNNIVEFKRCEDSIIDSGERYFLEVIPVNVNGEIVEFVYILQTQNYGFSRITPYSKYFLNSRVFGKSIANQATNTKVNAHGKFIVSFLNYIFYEREKPLSKIQQLDRKIIIEFLELYAKGGTGNQKGQWINKETSEKAGKAIMRFVYWLKYGNTDESITGLRKITKSDFDIVEKNVKKKRLSLRNGDTKQSSYTERIIACPSDYIKVGSLKGDTSKNRREKVVEPNLYTVKLLIDASQQIDKLMTLPIVLGAFVGLRQGDVVQMNRHRLSLPLDMDVTKGYNIDLIDEVQLSDKSTDSGKIKIHRVQPIFEPFLPIVVKAYNNHIDLLEERGLNAHKYGALFFNNRDNGIMRQKSLNRRFDMIVKTAIEKLEYDALVKNKEYAITQYDILTEAKFKIAFHSLRYFYTQSLEKLLTNEFEIMKYRGDGCVESQNSYRSNTTTEENIKKVMDMMKGELNKYGFNEIL